MDKGSFEYEQYKTGLSSLLHVPQEDIEVQLVLSDKQQSQEIQTKVHLPHYRASQGSVARRREQVDAEYAQMAEQLSQEAFDALQSLTRSASSASESLQQPITTISKLTLEQQSYRESRRPKPAQKAEDLMTFHLPRESGKTSTRRDLMMLKEWLDEKEASRQKTPEMRLLDKSDKMSEEMLKTQQVRTRPPRPMRRSWPCRRWPRRR